MRFVPSVNSVLFQLDREVFTSLHELKLIFTRLMLKKLKSQSLGSQFQ
jgi:hypothetical protein